MKLSAIVSLMIICIFFGSSQVHSQSLSNYEKWLKPSYFKGFNISTWNHVEDRIVTQEDFSDLKNTGWIDMQIK